jgi:serine/threonine protein kinase
MSDQPDNQTAANEGDNTNAVPADDFSDCDLYIGEDRLRARAMNLGEHYKDGIVFDDGAATGMTFTAMEALHGGTGVVHRVKTDGHASVDRALKVLLVDIDTEAGHQRWIHECELLQRVNKVRGAPSVHRTGELRGLPVIVMDWAPGETLDEYFTRIKAYDAVVTLDEAQQQFDEVTQLIVEVLRTLAEMFTNLEDAGHACPVHRDLKPQNIKRQPGAHSGAPKLTILDFGEASFEEDSEARGSTPHYVSPEQRLERLTQNEGPPVDHRADQYAVGVMLQRLLASLRDWEEDQQADAPRPIQILRMQIRAAINIAHRMTAREPADRFQSFTEAGDALEAASQTKLPMRKSRLTAVNAMGVAGCLIAAFLLGKASSPSTNTQNGNLNNSDSARSADSTANRDGTDGRANPSTDKPTDKSIPVKPQVPPTEQIRIIRDWYDRLTNQHNITRQDLTVVRSLCATFVEEFPDDPLMPATNQFEYWITSALSKGQVRISPVRFVEKESDVIEKHTMSFSITLIQPNGVRIGPSTGAEQVDDETDLDKYKSLTVAWDPNTKVQMHFQHDTKDNVKATQAYRLSHSDVLYQPDNKVYRWSANDSDFEMYYRIERLGFPVLPAKP